MHRMVWGRRARRAPATRVRLIDLGREYHTIRRELLAACERVLDRMQLLGGEEVRAFEAEMAAFLGAAHVTGVASGHRRAPPRHCAPPASVPATRC